MRYWKWIAIAVALILLTAIYNLPQILSTTFGKRFLIHTIESKTHTAVSVKALHLSWFGPQRLTNLEMENQEFKGSVEELQAAVPLWSLSGLFQFKNFGKVNGDLSLKNGSFTFIAANTPNAAIEDVEAFFRLHRGAGDFTANGRSTQGEQTGSFSLQGQVQKFSNPLPEFSVRGDLTSFPTLPIARLLEKKGHLDESATLQILGATLNAQGSFSFRDEKGMFDLSVHATNVDTECNGTLEEKVLTLNSPLTATFRLTPELSQVILKDMNPLFVTGLQAKNPIQLRVETRNFRYSLDAFKLSNLQIGQATLSVGQINCQNGGSLGALVSLMKNNYLSTTEQMIVWFSPLPFQLHNGILETGRMDALVADSVHICTWGKINLNNQHLDMNLGLPADALRKSFGIKGLPSDYVLKIPLTGTTKDPKLATAGAAAKIAAMVASKKGPLKGLPGGVLNLFTQSDNDVPPAVRPFPWE